MSGIWIQENTFVNCSLQESNCERGDYTIGPRVVGVCNTATQLCMCPEGYGGGDDFDNYNDCHVNVNARYVLRIIGATSCTLSAIVTIGLLFKLLLQWGILYVPDTQETSEPISSNRKSLPAAVPQSINSKNASPFKDTNEERTIFDDEANNQHRFQGSGTSNQRRSYNAQNATRTSLALTVTTINSNNNNNELPNPEGENHHQERKTSLSPSPIFMSSVPSATRNNQPLLIKEESNDRNPSNDRKPSSIGIEQSNDHDPPSENGSERIGSMSEKRRSVGAVKKTVTAATEFTRKLTSEVKKLPRPSSHAIKELSPVGGTVGVSANTTMSAFIQERKRKRFTILFVVLFIAFSVSLMAYEYLLLSDHRPANNDAGANFFLAAVITSICSGFWILAYIWFGNLPSLAAYGNMFKVKSILITYPNLVAYLTAIHITVGTIVAYGCYFVLPLSLPHLRYRFNTFALVFTLVYVIDFIFVFAMICRLLLIQFATLESSLAARRSSFGSSKSNDEDRHQKKYSQLTKAKLTVIYALAFCLVAGPIAIAMTLIIAITRFGRSNTWFFTQFYAILGSFVSLFALHIVVNRSSGTRRSLNRPRSERTLTLPGQQITASSPQKIFRKIPSRLLSNHKFKPQT